MLSCNFFLSPHLAMWWNFISDFFHHVLFIMKKSGELEKIKNQNKNKKVKEWKNEKMEKLKHGPVIWFHLQTLKMWTTKFNLDFNFVPPSRLVDYLAFYGTWIMILFLGNGPFQFNSLIKLQSFMLHEINIGLKNKSVEWRFIQY